MILAMNCDKELSVKESDLIHRRHTQLATNTEIFFPIIDKKNKKIETQPAVHVAVGWSECSWTREISQIAPVKSAAGIITGVQSCPFFE